MISDERLAELKLQHSGCLPESCRTVTLLDHIAEQGREKCQHQWFELRRTEASLLVWCPTCREVEQYDF